MQGKGGKVGITGFELNEVKDDSKAIQMSEWTVELDSRSVEKSVG
jgi:hypothetical protein